MNKGLLLWIAAFAGGLLLYSAYKGQNPLDTLTTSLDTGSGTLGHGGNPGPVPGSTTTAEHLMTVDDNGIHRTIPAVYRDNPHNYVP